MGNTPENLRVLAIDIGGSKCKAAIVDARGEWQSERERLPTPKRARPPEILDVLDRIAAALAAPFDVIGVGFPGVVEDGVTRNAPNLGKGWRDHPFAAELSKHFGKPCRVVNDADAQGLAARTGQGTELVLTLGTGVGSALFRNGMLIPNTEFGHLPFLGGESFEGCLGDAALQELGAKRWAKLLREALELLREGCGAQLVLLGGGNAKLLEDHEPCPAWLRTVRNRAGITGAALLWAPDSGVATPTP